MEHSWRKPTLRRCAIGYHFLCVYSYIHALCEYQETQRKAAERAHETAVSADRARMHAEQAAASASERAKEAAAAQAAAQTTARQLRAQLSEAEDAQRRLAAQLQEHTASVAKQHSTLMVRFVCGGCSHTMRVFYCKHAQREHQAAVDRAAALDRALQAEQRATASLRQQLHDGMAHLPIECHPTL